MKKYHFGNDIQVGFHFEQKDKRYMQILWEIVFPAKDIFVKTEI